MEKNYLKLNDLSSYKIAYNLSNYVWDVVISWGYFEKDTVGKQFARSVDSISANIAEGFGRFGKKDKVNFYRYAFGSVKESLDWNEKSKKRSLLKEKEYKYILGELQKLPKEINGLIKFTNDNLEH
ncbi:MAG: four helix bundle protein [Candidatus Moraniibacteriota bacterium]